MIFFVRSYLKTIKDKELYLPNSTQIYEMEKNLLKEPRFAAMVQDEIYQEEFPAEGTAKEAALVYLKDNYFCPIIVMKQLADLLQIMDGKVLHSQLIETGRLYISTLVAKKQDYEHAEHIYYALTARAIVNCYFNDPYYYSLNKA